MVSSDSPAGPGPSSLVGQVIDGRYRIDKPIGAGGMGSVFLAEQINLHRRVALKVITTDEPNARERFRREAEALAAVSHPAIVAIHDFLQLDRRGDQPGQSFLIMAFIDGQDLARYIVDTRGGQPLSLPEVVELLVPTASALVELHAKGIVHRDLKPANLVRFQRADGRPRVKLVDFGFARREDDPNLTAAGFVVGTPEYLAPEVIDGQGHSPASDIYALAVTMHKLLTGYGPHGPGGLRSIIQRTVERSAVLPLALQQSTLSELLPLMLKRDPEQRPDAAAVFEELDRMPRPGASKPPPMPSPGDDEAVDTTDLLMPTPSQARTQIRPARRRGRSAWVSAATLLLGLGVGAAAGLLWSERTREAPGSSRGASAPRSASTRSPPNHRTSARRSGGPGGAALPSMAPPTKTARADAGVDAGGPGPDAGRSDAAVHPARSADATASPPRADGSARVDSGTPGPAPPAMAARRDAGTPPLVRDRPRPAPPAAAVAAITKQCATSADAYRLYRKARRIVISWPAGNWRLAQNILQALVEAPCASRSVRLWSGFHLAILLTNRRQCAAARDAWKIYGRYYRQVKKSAAPSFPGCK